MNRSKNIQRLSREEFDLCIIGGGASGAGCALDATLRGLKVALIERTDFAAETSSRSTKLVHGGVRYLEQAFKKFDFAQLRQVRHGLEERHIVLHNAPHLAHPLGLITPVFSWWEGLYFSIGLKLYDWFATRRNTPSASGADQNLPSSKWLSKQEALALMPGLSSRIHSAVLYYDGQLDDARYCLALVQSAAERNAAVANHLEVKAFERNETGKLLKVTVQDHLSEQPDFQIKAKCFLNCTGPFSDHIRQMANPALLPRMQPSKGVHLLLPLEILDSKMAMLIPKTRDGRVVFAIPFEGNLLLGTTDEPYSDLATEPMVHAREVDFLLDTLQPFVSKKLEKETLKAGFGGIRPLLAPSRTARSTHGTKTLLRDHEVEYDPVSGMFSLLGGKWTTYRLMAQDAVNAVAIQWSAQAPASTTENLVLAGAEHYSPDHWKKLQQAFALDPDICQHLASKYGSRAEKVLALTATRPELADRILPEFPFLKAEIVYAVHEEMAMSIRDFMARRIRLEIMDWTAAREATPMVAQWMGECLGWSASKQETEAKNYLELLHTFRSSARKGE